MEIINIINVELKASDFVFGWLGILLFCCCCEGMLHLFKN